VTGPGLLKVSERKEDMVHNTVGSYEPRPLFSEQQHGMVHNLFGGSGSDSAVGRAALTRPLIASGEPNFYGGLKVLAFLQVILGQFLHEETGECLSKPMS
jgi:hypothetical protein